MTSNATLMRDAALGLASRGLRVHPLIARGKTPITEHGVIDATTDNEQIAQWWKRSPLANIGIATGHGIVVIDLDSDNAESTLIELEQTYGALPSTRVAETGRGSHWYFRVPDDVIIRNKVKIAPDIDVRGDGGFVVAPPSVHENGTTYGWRFDRPTAKLPDKWIELLRAPSDRGPIDLGDDSPIPIGQQNDEIFRRIAKLRGQGVEIETARIYVRGLNIPNDPGRDAWTNADLDAIVERVYTTYEPGERPAEVRHTAGSPQRQGEAPRTDADNMSAVTTLNMRAKSVQWLWKGYIPEGMLVIQDGEPGLGKTSIWLDIAAAVTTGGKMPDGSKCRVDKGDVLLLAVEDAVEETLVPALMAAGADRNRVHLLNPRMSFPRDLDALADVVKRFDARMLIIDPITAHLEADTHKDSDVRGALSDLIDFGRKHKLTLCCNRHLNKGNAQAIDNPISRGTGSGAFTAMARHVWLVGKDPTQDPDDDNAQRFVLASTKFNLGAKPAARAYTIEQASLEQDGEIIDTRRVVWGDISSVTPQEILRGRPRDKGNGSKVDDCIDWLTTYIGDDYIQVGQGRAAAHAAGYSDGTLRLAVQRLGCVYDNPDSWANKGNSGEQRVWSLKPPTAPAPF